ncbi:hypothetical protein [Xanthobacter sediminis]
MPLDPRQPRDVLAALGLCLLSPDARAHLVDRTAAPAASPRGKIIEIINSPSTHQVRSALADMAADKDLIAALDESRWSLLGTGRVPPLSKMAVDLWRNRVDENLHRRSQIRLLDMDHLQDDSMLFAKTSLRLEIGHPSDVTAAHRAIGSSPIPRLSHGTRNALAIVAISHLGAAGAGVYRDGYMPLWWVTPGSPTSGEDWLATWRNPASYDQAARQGWAVIRGGWSRPGGYFATMDPFISIASTREIAGVSGEDKVLRSRVYLGDRIARSPIVQAIIDGVPISYARIDLDQAIREPEVFLALSARILLGADFVMSDIAGLFAAATPKITARTVDRWLTGKMPLHPEHARMLVDQLRRRVGALRSDLEAATHATAIAEWIGAQPTGPMEEPEEPEGAELTTDEIKAAANLVAEEIQEPEDDVDTGYPLSVRARQRRSKKQPKFYNPTPALEDLPTKDLRSAANFALSLTEHAADGTISAVQIPPALAGQLIREGRIRIASYEVVPEELQSDGISLA